MESFPRGGELKDLSEFKPNIEEVIEKYKVYCRFEDTDRPSSASIPPSKV